MNEDAELLRRFAEHGAQDAFAEFARRHLNLVYAAALRQVGGDTHLAEDVTQAVFLTLASRAGALHRHAALSGWLHTTTRFIALKAVRTQARWHRREQEASRMNIATSTNDPAWEELRPVIDAAMHELGEKDRAVLLLRFFAGKSLADVGAELGLAENAARMRVGRALEKLRARLARRGITSTAAVLGAALAAQPAIVAPAALLAGLSPGALATTALAGGGAWMAALAAVRFMGATKLIAGAAAVLAAFGLGSFFGAHVWRGVQPAAPATPAAVAESTLQTLREENARLRAERAKVAAVSPAPVNASGIAAKPALDSAALERLRALRELQERHLITPIVQFLQYNGDGKLTRQFAELFALTPAEQAGLQAIVDRTRERLAPLERENATVDRRADGSVVITIKAFPEQGGAIYDAFMKDFAAVLGPERQSAFAVVGAQTVEKSLGWMGAAKQTITFTPKLDAPDGRTISVHREHRLPMESGASSSTFTTVEEAATWVGPIAALLPKDFARPK